jgi:hypothetical protein
MLGVIAAFLSVLSRSCQSASGESLPPDLPILQTRSEGDLPDETLPTIKTAHSPCSAAYLSAPDRLQRCFRQAA